MLIERYYDAVKQEVIQASGPGTAAVRTVEREHEKRRAEESVATTCASK